MKLWIFWISLWPEGREGCCQAGPKGRYLEVRPRRAPRLLVSNISSFSFKGSNTIPYFLLYSHICRWAHPPLSFAKGLKQSHIFFWILKHIYWTHCLYVFDILKHICWAHLPPGVSGAEWIIINSDILTFLIYFLIFSKVLTHFHTFFWYIYVGPILLQLCRVPSVSTGKKQL